MDLEAVLNYQAAEIVNKVEKRSTCPTIMCMVSTSSARVRLDTVLAALLAKPS
jgi:hypothetical protein